MKNFNFISRLIRSLFLLFIFSSMSLAQVGFQFGQNKVHYKNFEWSVFRTEHFDVHYYPEEKEAAYDAARMAERGYTYLSEVLKYEIEDRIPLVLYASLNDFQQTNVIAGMIGDGTRGVTESARKRVVLPITGSYREFNHVLVHELVHAFQFDIMSNLNKGQNTRFNPPLWFVEGMAEYLSNGMDNTTRMWVRDGLEEDNLMSIKDLNSTFDIRVYRIGQSVWHFVGETYGKDKVGEILKQAVRSGNIENAFDSVIGIKDTLLTHEWHKFSKKLVMTDGADLVEPDSVAEKITKREGYYHRMNLIPALSPDGKAIAYIANKNMHDEIFLMSQSADGTIKEERLIKGGQSKSFETLRIFASTINWSRDGQKITFVTKAGKNDALYVMNPFAKEILFQFEFEEMNGLQSPSFAPDGNRISFTGIVGGRSDLYIVDTETGKLSRLTGDRFAVLHPQWSPDGESIAFITDRGRGTDEANLLFGDYDLAVYHLKDGSIDVVTDLNGNVINPQWAPENDHIAFISDHQGIPNIYTINLSSGAISQITKLKNGVGGITETTPAFSWSANVLVFSTFRDMGWSLYKMKMQKAAPLLSDAGEDALNFAGQQVPFREKLSAELTTSDPDLYSWLPPLTEPNEMYGEYQLAEHDSIEAREYSSKLGLDGALLGGSFGGFYGSIGGAQLFFSDMLGNQNLYVSTGLRFSDFLRSDVDVLYFNQGRRINYGVQLYQLTNLYGSFFTFDGLGFVQQTYRGGNLFGMYPFNRFSRVELSVGVTAVEQDLVFDIFNGRDFDRESQDIGTLTFGQVGAAWVYDNTMYGPMGPFNGNRARFSVQQAVKDLKFTTYLADYRRYFSPNQRTVLAWRVLGLMSAGEDQQIYQLGGPFTYRGADYGDLLGSKFLLQSLELRFPLLPFLPPSTDFLSGFAFADAAAAWGFDIPGFGTEKFQPFTTQGGFRLNDLRSAAGVGARVNIGYFALQYHIAWPTDLQGFSKPYNQFSLGTFF